MLNFGYDSKYHIIVILCVSEFRVTLFTVMLLFSFKNYPQLMSFKMDPFFENYRLMLSFRWNFQGWIQVIWRPGAQSITVQTFPGPTSEFEGTGLVSFQFLTDGSFKG